MESMINQEQTEATLRGYTALFMERLRTSDISARTRLLATEQPSKSGGEQYSLIGPAPSMEEHRGGRVVQKLSEHPFVLLNKAFANAIEIDLDDLDDDNAGKYNASVMGVADKAMLHMFKLLRTLLNNAFAGGAYACYDGKALCANDHSWGDNNLDLALSATNFATAVQRLRELKDDNDDELDNNPTHLIVGADKEVLAYEITQAQFLGVTGEGTKTNVLSMMGCQPLVIPGLTAGFWFVADLSKPYKPLIAQLRKATMAQIDRTREFSHNVVQFGARYRGNAGMGVPQVIVGSDGVA